MCAYCAFVRMCVQVSVCCVCERVCDLACTCTELLWNEFLGSGSSIFLPGGKLGDPGSRGGEGNFLNNVLSLLNFVSQEHNTYFRK